MMNYIKNMKGNTILFIIIFLFLAALPFYMPMFRVSLYSKYICFAIVALGLDMIWGYTGILSLGHGVYFGLGAYCMAMYLKMEAAGNTLPDFMTWSGVTELPFVWELFKSPVFALAMVVVVPVLLSVIIGYLTFANRIKGVYFSILSQALAMILSVLLIGSQEFTGGSNGLTNFTTAFGFALDKPMTKLVLFYITLFVLTLIFVLCKFLVNKRVGKVFLAIRDGENRTRFTGYNPTKYKVFVYALSALISGIAGALYVMQVGIISPAEVGITPSVEMVIWVAIGGKATLVGPILGAILVNGMKTFASESFPELWSYFIGFLFIFVILWLPGGIISLKELPKKILKFVRKGSDKNNGREEESVC